MQREDFYILVRIKGNKNKVISDIDFINSCAQYLTKYFGDEVFNILGIGITKSAIRSKYEPEEIFINRNQIYVILHTKNFGKIQPYMDYTVEKNGINYDTSKLDYHLFAKDERDLINIDKLTESYTYLNIDNNFINMDIFNKILKIRKDANNYKTKH